MNRGRLAEPENLSAHQAAHLPTQDAVLFDQVGHGGLLPLVEQPASAAKNIRMDRMSSTARESKSPTRSHGLEDLRPSTEVGLLLFEKRERMRHAFVGIGGGDVVRVAANDHKSRVWNQSLVRPGPFHRVHLGPVRSNHQRG
jgi:hypothetical protein